MKWLIGVIALAGSAQAADIGKLCHHDPFDDSKFVKCVKAQPLAERAVFVSKQSMCVARIFQVMPKPLTDRQTICGGKHDKWACRIMRFDINGRILRLYLSYEADSQILCDGPDENQWQVNSSDFD